MNVGTKMRSMFRIDPRLDKKFIDKLRSEMVFAGVDEARRVTARVGDMNQGGTVTMDARPILDALPDDMIDDIAVTSSRDGICIPRHLRPISNIMTANPQDMVVLDAGEFSRYAKIRRSKDATIEPEA
jgi:hypothetical protein